MSLAAHPSTHASSRRAARLVAAIVTAVVMSIGAGALALPAAVAAPDGYSVKVKPVRKLPARGTVAVTVAGLPADVGVYVRLCKKPAAGQRPGAADCMQGDGEGMSALGGVWAIAQYPYGARPADGSVVDPSKPFALDVRARFGKVDCRKTACAVVVRRDHQDGADVSYDRVIPVTFR